MTRSASDTASDADAERDPRPTTVMRRDELRGLIHAMGTPPPVAAHTVPRLARHPQRMTTAQSAALDAEFDTDDDDVRISPLIVLGIVVILLGTFIATVAAS